MSLLMAVANEPPRPPHAVAPVVPQGLSQIRRRSASRNVPRTAFRPTRASCRSARVVRILVTNAGHARPPTAGRRHRQRDPHHPPLATLAGVGKHAVLRLRPASALHVSGCGDVAGHRLLLARESRWGATLGKALLALTVIDANGTRPRPGAVFMRVLVFQAPSVLLNVIAATLPGIVQVTASPGYGAAFAGVQILAVLTTLFSTARRRNGYAGVHDLVSGTRVVTRPAQPRGADRVEPARNVDTPSSHTRPARGLWLRRRPRCD